MRHDPGVMMNAASASRSPSYQDVTLNAAPDVLDCGHPMPATASYPALAAEPAPPGLLDRLRRWGSDSASFQVLQPGFLHQLTRSDGNVAYVDTGRAWVTAGSPLNAPEHLASDAYEFTLAARQAGRRVVFAGVEGAFAQRVELRRLAIGQQPILDPRAWPTTLQATASLREQLRRARARGVTVREIDPDSIARNGSNERRAIEALQQCWLAERRLPPLGFLVATTPLSLPFERRYFAASRSGRLVGFASLAPIYVRNGWLLEHLVRSDQAPNGSTELLVDAALRAASRLGSRVVSLGLAPLSGPVSPWLAGLGRLGSRFYDCRSLERFKAKFRPAHWEPMYLCFPKGQTALSAAYDAVTATTGQPLPSFAWRTWARMRRRR